MKMCMKGQVSDFMPVSKLISKDKTLRPRDNSMCLLTHFHPEVFGVVHGIYVEDDLIAHKWFWWIYEQEGELVRDPAFVPQL